VGCGLGSLAVLLNGYLNVIAVPTGYVAIGLVAMLLNPFKFF